MWTSGFQVGVGFVMVIVGIGSGTALTIGIGGFLILSGITNGVIRGRD